MLRTDEVVESAVERSRSPDEGVVYLYVLLSHVSKKRAEVKVTQAPDVAVEMAPQAATKSQDFEPTLQSKLSPRRLS